MALCHYHPDRPGIGICIRCRVVICSSCSTKVDGVNHCHACMKALGQRQQRGRSLGIGSSLAALFVLGFVWLVFFGLALAVQGRLAP